VKVSVLRWTPSVGSGRVGFMSDDGVEPGSETLFNTNYTIVKV